jgi:hypothetical protein
VMDSKINLSICKIYNDKFRIIIYHYQPFSIVNNNDMPSKMPLRMNLSVKNE